MRLLIVILLVMLGVLQYHSWVGPGSLGDLQQLREAVVRQQQQNANLQRRNLELEAEIHDLKTGLGAVDGLARYDLGMIGENETFYEVVNKP